MILEIIAVILIIEYAVIDSFTTIYGLYMFGGIPENDPLFDKWFKYIGVSTSITSFSSMVENILIVILLTVIEIAIVILLYTGASTGNIISLYIMVFLSLIGAIICVLDAKLLHKCFM